MRCGKGIEKLPAILERSRQMIIEFLSVVQAAHLSFLPAEQLDSLAIPTYKGQQRLAGVDIQKPRLRAVAQALIGHSSVQIAEQRGLPKSNQSD